VFLGEDLLHSGEQYSPETSRVIDEEVARILRESEIRADEFLRRHRAGLDAVAAALLERETIDGSEVGRLVDEAFGGPVHDPEDTRAHFTARMAPLRQTEEVTGPGSDLPPHEPEHDAGGAEGATDRPGDD